MSTVSVIVPCYNYAHFLPECVESVLSQPGVDVHVLIIDDASSDNTAEVAAELVDHNLNVEFRRHPKNIGHIATYNEGIEWAQEEYTILLSADDKLTPGALIRASQLMDAHPEIGFVYGASVKFNTDQPLPRPRLPSASCKSQIYNGLDWFEAACRTGNTFIASPEVVVRTQLQHKLGGYRPELPHTGDIEMWMRFAIHAAVGRILDADQAYYRIHSRNMHKLEYSSALKDIQQRRAAFDTIFQDYKDQIPRWEQLQEMVGCSLASEALWEVCQAVIRREVAWNSIIELLKYANKNYRGKFLDLGYLRVYLNLSSRILRSIQGKMESSFS
jgi:glycosyltransferase involved in cell wall biosynthesis